MHLHVLYELYNDNSNNSNSNNTNTQGLLCESAMLVDVLLCLLAALCSG